ncbi:MAG: hypothetical protein IJQ98_04555 [Oscillospiraceae bacterium]|nr:hypothetical protein [Oscillospiraceae bacterium]MBR3407325.1 hypothetical protein [Paludibacteraceae bacterium]
MEEDYMAKRISSILEEQERLSQTVQAMRKTDIRRYPGNYRVLSSEAARRSEQITCRLRHMVYETTDMDKTEYLLSAADAQGVQIQRRGGVLEITLPGLVPKRRRRQNPEFLLDPFTAAMSRFVEEHDVPRYEHCVVCFAHVYDRKLSRYRVRDYDNLELKQLLDVATSFVMLDDSGLLCDAYYTTELGESDCTRMFIMDSRHFPVWLAEREKSITSIKDFSV